jgi:hypothetical protein
MKNCYKCKQSKPTEDYCKDKSTKDGLNNKCKACVLVYRAENTDRIKQNDKKRYLNRKEKMKATQALHYSLNKKSILKKNKEHKKRYRDSGMCQDHPHVVAFRKGSCFDCVLRKSLRQAHRRAVFLVKSNKNVSCLSVLGCSTNEFKLHLESLFVDGMSWNNYGKKSGSRYWVIDHVVPLGFAKAHEEAEMLCYYKNLQPLWNEDNASKGAWYDGKLYKRTTKISAKIGK